MIRKAPTNRSRPTLGKATPAPPRRSKRRTIRTEVDPASRKRDVTTVRVSKAGRISVYERRIVTGPDSGLLIGSVQRQQSHEIQRLRKLLGLTQEHMAEMLGCSTRSLSTYEKSSEVPTWLRARLRETNTLIAEVLPLLTPDELQEWMHAQLPAMQGRTPIRVIADGDSIALFLLIRDIAMGGHS